MPVSRAAAGETFAIPDDHERFCVPRLKALGEVVQVFALPKQQQQIVTLQRAIRAVLAREFRAAHDADTPQIVILGMG